jgi:uncharacterized protein YecE (DUF72 family)
MSRVAKAYVGMSGWSYAHWKDDIYPPGLPSRDWLRFIAERYDTVEVNSSFYRLPNKAWVRRWAAEVPEGFRFAFKLWRAFSHYRRLQEPEPQLGTYMEALDPLLPDQRGPLLLQLPPQMPVDLDALEGFLHALRDRVGDWPLCVEFREKSWLVPQVTALLDEHDAALCVHDMVWAAPVSEPNGASIVYVRRHGPKPRYGGSYSDEQVRSDARNVERWLSSGRDVYVYYNNDRGGNAPRNAASLRRVLGLAAADFGVRRRRTAKRRTAARPGGRTTKGPGARRRPDMGDASGEPREGGVLPKARRA